MPVWLPVAVTIALGVAGLAVQACLMAYFIGRMKENQAGAQRLVDVFQSFTEKALQTLTTRLDAADELASSMREDRASMNARLEAVETNTHGLQQLRETMAGFAATFQGHRERSESDMAHVNRSLEGVQRQLASIASGGAGRVVMLGKDDVRG